MLSESFKSRMADLLGAEYDAFISALEGGEAVRGARVNLIKRKGGGIPEIEGYTARSIPYVKNGYILEGDGQIGRSAAHHAGLIYMQDPGAMAAMAALEVEADWWVADLCAAPGGKSSQIAERLGEDGFLLSNEYVPKRAKTIVSNFERLGIRRAMITSMDTSALGELFSEAFDLVVVDAPCSGEGMFRKSEEAREEWTPDMPLSCAERQRYILKNAYGLLKPGGKLLYSTCTWSTEENEGIALWLRDSYPDLRIIPVKEELRAATADGIVIDGYEELKHARRCYPHTTEGEGQFVVLFEKENKPADKPTILYKSAEKPISKDEKQVIDRFFADTLIKAPEARCVRVGDNVVLLEHDCPIPGHSVFMAGVLLGEIKHGAVYPSHQFFSAYGHLFKNKEVLLPGDSRIEKYLSGEEIDARSVKGGWCAVMLGDAPLGGGKASGGRIKNRYPKGLRNR